MDHFDSIDLATVETLVPSAAVQVPLVVYLAIAVEAVDFADFVATVDVLVPSALANVFELPAVFRALLYDVFQNLPEIVQAVVDFVVAADVETTAVVFAPSAPAIVFDQQLGVAPYLFDNFLVALVKALPAEHFVVAVSSTAVGVAHFVLATASEMLGDALPCP